MKMWNSFSYHIDLEWRLDRFHHRLVVLDRWLTDDFVHRYYSYYNCSTLRWHSIEASANVFAMVSFQSDNQPPSLAIACVLSILYCLPYFCKWNYKLFFIVILYVLIFLLLLLFQIYFYFGCSFFLSNFLNEAILKWKCSSTWRLLSFECKIYYLIKCCLEQTKKKEWRKKQPNGNETTANCECLMGKNWTKMLTCWLDVDKVRPKRYKQWQREELHRVLEQLSLVILSCSIGWTDLKWII